MELANQNSPSSPLRVSALPSGSFQSELQRALGELVSVLETERDALRILDRGGIDEAAATKLAIDARIHALVDQGTAPTPGDKELVERVRTLALHNQVLIAHARACIRGALATVSGGPSETYSAAQTGRPSASNVAPRRLNVNG